MAPAIQVSYRDGDGTVLATADADHVGPLGRPRTDESDEARAMARRTAEHAWEMASYPKYESQKPSLAEYQMGTARNLVGQADSMKLAWTTHILAKIDGVKVSGCQEEPAFFTGFSVRHW